MKIAVVTKPNMTDHPLRRKVLSMLESGFGLEVFECGNSQSIPADADRVLVFGGDGTVLDAVRVLEGNGTPVLGVNLGNLGFLTSFEQDSDARNVANALIGGKSVKRMLLDVCIDTDSFLALNEVVVKTGGTRPITLDVSIDGKFADSFHSDGLIISSPAGSTAYSLSAGGPVLAPDVDALVINPICAHSLHSRPLVISASSVVAVTVAGGEGAAAVVDGNCIRDLKGGEGIIVKKSEKTAKFICVEGENFYSKLLMKMNRWGTTLR